jgi:hypothetical protein
MKSDSVCSFGRTVMEFDTARISFFFFLENTARISLPGQ